MGGLLLVAPLEVHIEGDANVRRQSDDGISGIVGVCALIGNASPGQVAVAIVLLHSRHDVHGAPAPKPFEVSIALHRKKKRTTEHTGPVGLCDGPSVNRRCQHPRVRHIR